MDVISNRALRDFSKGHPDAEKALQAWRKLLERSSPRSFAELREVCGSVDIVGDKYVFDIRGNHYRVACYINFNTQRCYIRNVMTHVEYDRGRWK
jgi:mRNA interferase HigB